MKKYEIFQQLPSKQMVCVEATTTLQEAKERLSELRRVFQGDYFIFDREHGRFIIPPDKAINQFVSLMARARKNENLPLRPGHSTKPSAAMMAEGVISPFIEINACDGSYHSGMMQAAPAGKNDKNTAH